MKGKKSCPLAARIKKLMQADDDVGKIAQATPVMLARAMEIFLQGLCEKTAAVAAARQAKTISTSHLKQCVAVEETLDFLKEVVASAPDLPAEDAVKPVKRRRSSAAAEGDGEGEGTKKPRGRAKKAQQDGEGTGDGEHDAPGDAEGGVAAPAPKARKPRAPRRKAPPGDPDQSGSDVDMVETEGTGVKPARRGRASKFAALTSFQALEQDEPGDLQAAGYGSDSGGEQQPRKGRHKRTLAAQHMQGLDAPKVPPVHQPPSPVQPQAEVSQPSSAGRNVRGSSATRQPPASPGIMPVSEAQCDIQGPGQPASELGNATAGSQPALPGQPQLHQDVPAQQAAAAPQSGPSSIEGVEKASPAAMAVPSSPPSQAQELSVAAKPSVGGVAPKKEKAPSAAAGSSLRSSLLSSVGRKPLGKKTATAPAAATVHATPAQATVAPAAVAAPTGEQGSAQHTAADTPAGAESQGGAPSAPVSSTGAAETQVQGALPGALVAAAHGSAAPNTQPSSAAGPAAVPTPLPPTAHLAHLAAVTAQDYDDDYDNL